MAIAPTPEEAALEILRVAVSEYNVRAGQVVDGRWYIQRFNKAPWKWDDFRAGSEYAEQQGWLAKDGKLTAAGYAAAP